MVAPAAGAPCPSRATPASVAPASVTLTMTFDRSPAVLVSNGVSRYSRPRQRIDLITKSDVPPRRRKYSPPMSPEIENSFDVALGGTLPRGRLAARLPLAGSSCSDQKVGTRAGG